ncbi:MAG: hypothetical protein ACLFVL_06900 [Candidatus Aenigmatarchaeota archaeon]
MASDLIEDELKELEGRRILVVTDDGIAFLGKLMEFDDEALLLEEVYQACADEINWRDTSLTDVWKKGVKIRDVEESVEEGDKVGYAEWVKVNLEKMCVRMEHIARFWYGEGVEKIEETPSEIPDYSK